MNNENGKIRAKLKDGIISVRVLIKHQMESGRREHPSTGEVIPRHFIQEVICEHNGTAVMTLDWGWGISANPYLSFDIRNGAVGDSVRISWTDDQEQSAALETVIT